MKHQKTTGAILLTAMLALLALAPAVGFAATVTLAPNGAGDATNLTLTGAATNWQAAASADADDSYVSTSGVPYAKDLYALNDPIASGTINSVTVWIAAKAQSTPTQASARTFLKTGGTEYSGTAATLTTSYADYFTAYATNPFTGIAWTWTEVNALQAGVEMRRSGTGIQTRATRVWVVVDYTPPVVSVPIALDDTATVDEDDPATTINVRANDTDAGAAIISGVTQPTNGTVVITNAGADLTYEPDADYCNDGDPTDDFTYTLSPGASTATVEVTVNCVNDAPVAKDDDFTTDEDTQLMGDVLADNGNGADSDADGDTLTVTLDTDVSNGTLDLDSDGSFTYDPDENYCNDDGVNPVTTDDFTYTANDGTDDSNVATVSITVTCVNDPPEVSVSPASQTADYSDYIGTVTITATDVDSPPASDGGADLTLTVDGDGSGFINADLVPDPTGCTFDDPGQTCTWTMDGQVLTPGDNVYDIDFTANDGEDDSDNTDCSAEATPCRHELTVEPEDATVALDENNDVALQVVSDGGASGPFSLLFSAWETDDPDNAHDGTAEFGNLNLMVPKLVLKPVGPGSSVNGNCDFVSPDPVYPGEGYNQLALFECTFDAVPVNVYEVLASVEGLSATTTYYRGADDDMLSVFDPSLGFTTGGGWFYWPDTAIPADACLDEEPPVEPEECINPDPCAGLYAGDKTNFGWNMKYNKPRTKLQGSLLVMRHTEPVLVDGYCEPTDSYKVKSNALAGLSLGEDEDENGTYGWASFAGKATFREPGFDNVGNHTFVTYVEDHGEQGCNQDPADEFWIRVKDGDGLVVLEVNGPDSEPAGGPGEDGDDVAIECGNIFVPHKPAGGKP